MKRIVLLIIIGILILPVHYLNVDILLADPGVNYYVANSGSNSNDGLSPSSPWQTISKVNSELSGVISQGDNIYFNRGDDFSYAGALYPRRGGTSSNYMTFGAYGNGAKPILCNSVVDGRTIEGDNMGNTGYYIFENLEISNCDRHGIRIREIGVHDLIFSRIDFYNVGDYGIHLQYTDTFKIENCKYINGGRSGFLAQGGGGSNAVKNGKFWNLTVDGAGFDGIVFHYAGTDEGNYVGSNMWVENCTINNCGEAGIDVSFGTNPNANLYMKDVTITGSSSLAAGHSTRHEVYDNIYIKDCGDAFTATRDRNLIVRNSVFEDFNDDGFVINQNLNNYNCMDIAFYNNNIITDAPSDLVSVMRSSTGTTNNLLFKNNIFFSTSSSSPTRFVYYKASGASPDLTDTNSDWSYNMWWRLNGNMNGDHWYDGENGYLNWAEWIANPEVSNELRDNPEFVDASNSDFTLQSTSPCIDAGDWLTTTNGAGTGTTITVHEANYFFDGYDIVGLSGDNIFIGDDTNLIITDVDYDAETITVDRSITWDDGDIVSLSSYVGSAPDIGAREFVPSGPDTTSPQISNVILTESDPLDTDSSLGWINITATVTDNSEVDTVMINLSCSNGSSFNVSMDAIGSTYYYNTSTMFSDHGNYSYFIWANDTYGNPSISTVYDFSMPPNWDINKDGQCTILDFTLISNHYWETGQNGWIREDVDNNGIVQVLDLSLVNVHYGETWWI